jgi:hypothetical protein
MQPTSQPQPQSGNLMDSDSGISGMNDQMRDMRLQQPMTPGGGKPLKRADTETSEVDEFVDALQD